MSYYKKLLATNVLISTIYILAFSIIISIFSFSSSKKMYENSINDYINSVSEKIDTSISNAKVISAVLYASEAVQNYAETAGEESEFTTRKALNSYMYDVGIMLSAGAHLAVTKYTDNYAISTMYTSSLDYYLSSVGITRVQLDEIIEEFRTQELCNISYLFSKKADSSYLTIIIRSDSLHSINKYYMLLSYPIDGFFNNKKYNKGLISAVSLHDELVYISDEKLQKPVSDYILTGKTHGYRIYNCTSKNRTSISDLTYYFIEKGSYYISSFLPKAIIAFLICIPLLLIGIYIMRKITNKIYAPVSRLINALPNNGGMIENEFEFIISEFNKLESNNDENTRIINKFKMSAKDKFVSDLLFGTLPSHDIVKSINEYDFPKIKSNITVVIIEYANYLELTRSLSRAGIFNLKTTVTSLLYSLFADFSPCIITETSQDNHVLILQCDNITSLRVTLQTALLHLMEDMDIDISASIGTPVDSYLNVCDSYRSAIDVSRHQAINFERKVVETSSDLFSDSESRVILLPNVEAALIESISSCNYGQVHQLLQQIFHANHVTSNAGFAQLVIVLYSIIQKILYSFDVSEQTVFGENVSVYLDLKGCQSVSNLKSVLTTHLHTLMNYISNKHNERNTERSDEMKKFIEEHYTEDISLLDLAEYMNMSQEHTSRIFKQEIGTNFKEYLMKLRYEKAIALIEADPTMKMKDVADAVGCSNTKNLSRLLNKYKP